jgi:hypothetical protein
MSEAGTGNEASPSPTKLHRCVAFGPAVTSRSGAQPTEKMNPETILQTPKAIAMSPIVPW